MLFCQEHMFTKSPSKLRHIMIHLRPIITTYGASGIKQTRKKITLNISHLRAMTKSTIITSNLTFDRWDEIFGDAAITSAIVDRLTYKAILVDMEGDSSLIIFIVRISLLCSSEASVSFKRSPEKSHAFIASFIITFSTA